MQMIASLIGLSSVSSFKRRNLQIVAVLEKVKVKMLNRHLDRKVPKEHLVNRGNNA